MALETFDYPDGTTAITNATIQSGGVIVNSGELATTSDVTVVTWPSQYNGSANIEFTPNGNQNGYIRYIFRYEDADNYLAVLFRSSDSQVKLFQFVNGVSSQLSSNTLPSSSYSEKRVIGVGYFGGSISIYSNGTLIKEVKESSGISGTLAGFRVDASGGYSIDSISNQDSSPVIPTGVARTDYAFQEKGRSIAVKYGKILDTHSAMVANGDSKELWPFVFPTSDIPNWPTARFPLLMLSSSDHSGGDGGIYARVYDTQAGGIGTYGAFVEWQTVSSLPEFDHITQKSGRIYRDIINGTQTETPCLYMENGKVVMTYHNGAVFTSGTGGYMQNTGRAISTNGIDFVRDDASPILRYDQRYDNGDGHTGYFSSTENIINNDGSFIGTSAHGGGYIGVGPTQAVWESSDRDSWSIKHRFGRLRGEILDFKPDWAEADWIYTLGTDIASIKKAGEYYRVIFKVRPDVVFGGVNDYTTMCEILVNSEFNAVSAPNYFLPLGESGDFDDFANIDYTEFEYEGKKYGVHLANDFNGASSIGLVEIEDAPYSWTVFRPSLGKTVLQSYETSGMAYNSPASLVDGEVFLTLPSSGELAKAEGVAVTPSDYDVLDFHVGAISKTGDVNVSGRVGFYDNAENPLNGVGLYWYANSDSDAGEDRYFLALEVVSDGVITRQRTRKAVGQIADDSPLDRESPTARLDVGIRLVPNERRVFVMDGVSSVLDAPIGAMDVSSSVTPSIAFSTLDASDDSVIFKDVGVSSYSNSAPPPVAIEPTVSVTQSASSPTVGDNVTFTATATDANSISWTSTGGISLDATTGASITGEITAEGDYSVSATATGDGGSARATVNGTAQAVPANQPPTANAGPTQSVAAGAPVQLDASSSTSGTHPIASYEWSQTPLSTVILTNFTTATPSFTAPTSDSAQTLNFSVVAIDTQGNRSEPASTSVLVAAAVDLTPPLITLTGGNVVLNVGETFQEPGFKVFDNKGVEITSSVTVTVTGSTETTYPRVGSLEYDVEVDGIRAVTKTRLFTVIEVSELLEEVAKQKFVIDGDSVLHGFAGRANLEKVRFKLASTNTNIALDEMGCYDFDENETQKVEVITPSGKISSESGDVEWDGSDLYIRAGAFSSQKAHESARVVVFLPGDDRGIVFAGPGLQANLIIRFN